MSANNVNTTIADLIIPTYRPFVAQDVGQQNAANMIYQNMASTLTASRNGTLGNAANGQPIFKSDRERMQYLAGRINQTGCYDPRPAIALRRS